MLTMIMKQEVSQKPHTTCHRLSIFLKALVLWGTKRFGLLYNVYANGKCAMRSLSKSERMILLCNHHLYVSATAQRCITISCEKIHFKKEKFHPKSPKKVQ